MLEMKTKIGPGNYVELKFNGKPGDDIRRAMKANAYRWNSESGVWWRGSAVGAADFIASIRKLIDRENSIRRPDGNCWKCQDSNGFFRRVRFPAGYCRTNRNQTTRGQNMGIISKQLEKAIRDNFPGKNNAIVRKEIRDRIIDGLDPIDLKSKIAFSYSGLESLKAVQKVFAAETKPSMQEMIEMLDEPSKTLAAIREQGGDVR